MAVISFPFAFGMCSMNVHRGQIVLLLILVCKLEVIEKRKIFLHTSAFSFFFLINYSKVKLKQIDRQDNRINDQLNKKLILFLSHSF